MIYLSQLLIAASLHFYEVSSLLSTASNVRRSASRWLSPHALAPKRVTGADIFGQHR
jgi:hypothetical protein